MDSDVKRCAVAGLTEAGAVPSTRLQYQAPSPKLTHKPVANARFRAEVDRLVRILLELFPQPAHIDMKIMRLRLGIGSPDGAENLAVCQNFSTVLDEEPEERVFLAGELDRHPLDRDD